MKKTVSYRIKQILLPIFGAAALIACKKDEKPQIVQKDTWYVFDAGGLPHPQPVSQIQASCDSVQVRFVYIKPTGKWNLLDPNSRAWYVKRAEDYFSASPAKVKPGGDFSNFDSFTIDEQGRLQFLGFNKQH